MQIDKINDILWKRELILVSLVNKSFYQTKNKILIEYILKYADIIKLDQNILYQINFVKLKKEILLLCRLVSFGSRKQTTYHRNINEKSSINWGF